MEVVLLLPIVWTICLHLAALALGRPIHSWLTRGGAPTGSRLLDLVLASLLGFGALVFLTLGLGVAGLLHARLLVGLVVVLAALGLAVLARRGREIVPVLRAEDALFVLALLFTASFLPLALDPVLHHDELTYHVLIPKQYLADHTITKFPFNVYANMPHVVELLYVPALAIGDLTAPRMLSTSFNFLALAGVAAFGVRILPRWAAGILPVMLVAGKNLQSHIGLSNVEPTTGFFLLAGVLAWFAWTRTKNRGFLWILAVSIGLAASSKYTAGPQAAVIGLAALVSIARAGLGRKAAVRAMATVVLVAFAVFLPWLVKNAIYTGNPVYPGFYRIFDGRYWSRVQEIQVGRSMAAAGGAYASWLDWLAIPFHLVKGDRYYVTSFSLSVMALFLIAPFLPSSWRRGMGLLQLVSIAGFLTWVFGIQQGRYLCAWIPVMVLSGGMALVPLARSRNALAAVVGVVLLVAGRQTFTDDYPYNPPWHRLPEPREQRITRNPNYGLCQRMNAILPPDAKVLSMWENMLFFLERPFWADSSYEAPSALAWLRRADDPAAFARELRDLGFTHVLINHRISTPYLKDNYKVFSVVDDKEYPAERHARDAQLLESFVRDQLEAIHVEEEKRISGRAPTTLYRIRTETL